MSERQTKKRRFSAGSFFLGLLFGAAAGTAAGLLLAPASGEQTRAKLQSQMKQGQSQATDTVDSIKEWSEDRQSGPTSDQDQPSSRSFAERCCRDQNGL